MAAPIEIILYDKNHEGKTYTQPVVTWGLLKRALRLSEEDDAPRKTDWMSRFKRWLHRNDRPISQDERQVDLVLEYVVDVFDRQFTVKQLEHGADISEIMTVMKTITSRAQLMSPTKRPPTPRVKHR